MKIDSLALAEIIAQVAAEQFGNQVFHRRPLMLAVEKELKHRNLWTPVDEKPSKSKGIKSRGLAAIDFGVSALSKTGALEHKGHDKWQIGKNILAKSPRGIAKTKRLVRIVPMSAKESWNWSIEKQQENYFLGELSGKLEGKYHCHKLLQAEPGTPVLFQYKGHIIASARLIGGVKLPQPTRYGYAKAMLFDPESICVFKPVNKDQMKAIWPGEFKVFSEATKKLSLAPLDRFFDLVSPTIRTPKNTNRADIDTTANDIEGLSSSPETERSEMIKCRLGQGKFRDALIDLRTKCYVTGVRDPRLLRASHIKPWKDSTNPERLDPHNGLLLTPLYDHLFDKLFISFEDDGRMLVSPKLPKEASSALGVELKFKGTDLGAKTRAYLAQHREAFRSMCVGLPISQNE